MESFGDTFGDGVASPNISYTAQLADTGSQVLIVGMIAPIGGPPAPFTGSPVTLPAAPATGTLYCLVQTTAGGVLSVKTSPSAPPTPDTGQFSVLGLPIAAGATDLALDGAVTSPDN